MEKRNVPKLRFKGFEDEVNTYKLEEITDYVDYRGKTPTKAESGIFLVTAKNIKKGYIDYDCSKEFISEDVYEDAMRRGKPKLGDVLLTTEAPLGNVAQIDNENIALAQRVIKFRGKENLNNDYLKQYFLSNIFQKTLVNKAIGTTVLGIQGKVLHKINLKIPSLKEQTKIANFLSNVDNIIEQQEGKVKDLEQYKKGMMQKIFKQEVRFKDENGGEYPEWIERKFYEIISKTKLGGNYDNSEVKTDFPLIKMGNLGRGNIILNKIEYIQKDSIIYENDMLKQGDLLFNTRNTLDLVGKVAIWRGELKKAYYNSNLLKMEFKKSIISSNYFMNYLFNSHNIMSQLKSIATGTTSVAAIYTRDLNNIKFKLPCLEEQTKIANFLSNVDNIIEKENEKLEELRQWKKGLLQQMFV